jgi:Flp pilus assembly protein TadG
MAMKNNISHLRKSNLERAQSLVEFAISLLLILTILTGAVEISLALFEYVTIRDAAQEGALFASINPKDTVNIKNRVIDAANDGVALTAGNISITSNGVTAAGKTYCEGTATTGAPLTITVRITRPHQIIMPLVGTFLGQQINVSASATSTILQPVC